MPHLVSPSDVDLPDPLNGSLTALSLTDPGETGSVKPQTSPFNPFEAYLREAPDRQSSVSYVDDLISAVIQPQLEGLRQARRLELHEAHPLYIMARDFQKKWRVPEASFLNFCELLSGSLDFPSVLLLNPSPLDHLPPDEMIEGSQTLSWIRDALQPMQLTFRDVIVLDMFSMATDVFMDDLGKKDQAQFVDEAFNLTFQFLQYIQPQVLISCQCSTQPQNDRWGFYDHVVARSLCSSVQGARAQRVHAVNIGSHAIRVVQGFHPNYAIKRMREGYGSEYDGMLQDLFKRIFQSFGEWKSTRDEIEQELHNSATLVRAGLLVQLSQVKLYRRMYQRALKSGVAGSLALESAEELESRIGEWVNNFST